MTSGYWTQDRIPPGSVSSAPATGQDEILLKSPVADQVPAYRNKPVAALVSAYLEDAYPRPNGSHALLIVLKDLWIASPDSLVFTHGFKVYNLYFRVEAYLQAKNGSMPLILMDTTLRELTWRTDGRHSRTADRGVV